MICFRDRTWCASPNCKNKCGRKLTEKDLKDAIKWWGGTDFPIAYMNYCDDNGEPYHEKA